jgi:tol-pal system protein YbgF
MKKKWLLLLFACFIVITFSQCASRKQVVRLENDLYYLRMQVEAVREDNTKLTQQLDQMNRSMADIMDEMKQTKADILSEMMSLKDQASFLDNKLEETGYRMDKILQKSEVQSGRPDADSTASIPDEKATERPGGSEALNPKDLYDAAYLDLAMRNYQLARQGFEKYLTMFPKSNYADNAQYWLGETYYAQADYKNALYEFKKIITDYPKGKKNAAALLKIGYCLAKLDDTRGAQRYLNMVIQEFPTSEEAKLAESKLAEIGRGNALNK